MGSRAFRLVVVCWLAALVPWTGLAGCATADAARRTLPPAVATALDDVGIARSAMVAIVQEVGSPSPRLQWLPDAKVNPASLMKLVTTYAGLELLGPSWRWTTPVWLHGRVAGGVLEGDLVIRGSGDPTLVLERLWLLLRQVQQSGVREIRGDIVLDRSAFTLPPSDPGAFDGEPLRPYNVGPDAVMLNFKSIAVTIAPDASRGLATIAVDPPLAGLRVQRSVPLTDGPCVDWRGALRADFSDPLQLRFAGAYPLACGRRVWSVAHIEPQRYNARALVGLWQAMGGSLGGTVHDGIAPAVPPSFEWSSPTLAEVVRDINKYSSNVMARQLFLTLGLERSGSGTLEAAREVVQRWALERFGAAAVEGLVIDNGAGLSRGARVTAELLARLLQAASAGPVMPELLASLPIGGVDGRLRGTRDLAGRSRLKTGSLRDVAAIAGEVLAPSGTRYLVVAIVNDPDANRAWPALDALVQWTADETPARGTP